MWWWGCGGWSQDPGPCPVDDTPHTACTPESVAAASSLTVPLTPPPALVNMQKAEAALAPVEFTTKTYSRAKHGPGRFRTKAK